MMSQTSFLKLLYKKKVGTYIRGNQSGGEGEIKKDDEGRWGLRPKNAILLFKITRFFIFKSIKTNLLLSLILIIRSY